MSIVVGIRRAKMFFVLSGIDNHDSKFPWCGSQGDSSNPSVRKLRKYFEVFNPTCQSQLLDSFAM